MDINEQVKELRGYADNISSVFTEDLDVLKGVFEEAANTIETLSEKTGGRKWRPAEVETN